MPRYATHNKHSCLLSRNTALLIMTSYEITTLANEYKYAVSVIRTLALNWANMQPRDCYCFLCVRLA